MEYFHGRTDFYREGPTAVTMGKFDGVHLGHQKLIRHIKKLENDVIHSVVFALKVNKEELLLTEEEQKRIIEQLGVSCLIDCPFLPEISSMEPERFVSEILVDRLHAAYITVGKDFRFGYQKKGDALFLKQLQEKYGFQVDILEKEQFGDRDISSTYIRECLTGADMETAAKLLGRPYQVSGEVLHGRKIGRTLGMPTVNLIPPAEKLLPPNGVYATRTWIDQVSYPGITNIGYKPTVGEKFKGVETYLFDLDQDLYGKHIVTEFYRFERPEQKFSSLEALKEQMHRDISFGKEYFSE
ncbi:MAG: bifunctional riboflavin kinase/FAD synthetase [Lachnospiraceae bacterium]|nr:bifunctional riboflavin kinase/FAD synthetase [Lachnospiraceae bacterium]MDD3796087.1 bifunctional riboflavin kinase/FAD synthetase [Lachnospiraceae bacterium]